MNIQRNEYIQKRGQFIIKSLFTRDTCDSQISKLQIIKQTKNYNMPNTLKIFLK